MNRKKILIADDNAFIVKSLSMKLTATGYDVVTAQDGASAVSGVRKEKPDLILLDLDFPRDVADGGGISWDGFLIIDWLRRLDEAKETPIIIISRSEPETYKDRAIAAGAIGFFHKPIPVPELLALIDQTLGQKSP